MRSWDSSQLRRKFPQEMKKHPVIDAQFGAWTRLKRSAFLRNAMELDLSESTRKSILFSCFLIYPRTQIM